MHRKSNPQLRALGFREFYNAVCVTQRICTDRQRLSVTRPYFFHWLIGLIHKSNQICSLFFGSLSENVWYFCGGIVRLLHLTVFSVFCHVEIDALPGCPHSSGTSVTSVSVCVRACVPVHTHVCMRACVCVCTRACMYACVCVCAYVCVRACKRACGVRVQMCVYVRACVRGRACVISFYFICEIV